MSQAGCRALPPPPPPPPPCLRRQRRHTAGADSGGIDTGDLEHTKCLGLLQLEPFHEPAGKSCHREPCAPLPSDLPQNSSPSPTLPQQQLIAIYACFVLLARNLSNKSAPILFFQLIVGGLLGAALALCVQYLTLAANGGTYANSATKASISEARPALPRVDAAQVCLHSHLEPAWL